MPTGQVLNGLRIHIRFARLLVLAEHEQHTNVRNRQTVRSTAECTAYTTGARVEELDHAWHHLVLRLRVAQATETAKAPAVGALL